MAKNKTQATTIDPAGFLAAIIDDTRREDCQALSELMSKVTGEPPRMWGPSIVGFGSYHYRYDSGREGDMCLVGFSPRKGDISVYLMADSPAQQALLTQLGKHRMGKACLYVKKLADVDLDVLSQLVEESIAEMMRRYPQ
jgi:hypothetical protein